MSGDAPAETPFPFPFAPPRVGSPEARSRTAARPSGRGTGGGATMISPGSPIRRSSISELRCGVVRCGGVAAGPETMRWRGGSSTGGSRAGSRMVRAGSASRGSRSGHAGVPGEARPRGDGSRPAPRPPPGSPPRRASRRGRARSGRGPRRGEADRRGSHGSIACTSPRPVLDEDPDAVRIGLLDRPAEVDRPDELPDDGVRAGLRARLVRCVGGVGVVAQSGRRRHGPGVHPPEHVQSSFASGTWQTTRYSTGWQRSSPRRWQTIIVATSPRR